MRLRVRVKNSLYPRRHAYAASMFIPEFDEYEGEVYPNPKWVGDNAFCLTTDDKQFPFRIIEKDKLECGWKLPPKVKSEAESKQISILVPTPKSTYIVTSDGLNHSCNCTGFSYRRTCSHVTEVTYGLAEAA